MKGGNLESKHLSIFANFSLIENIDFLIIGNFYKSTISNKIFENFIDLEKEYLDFNKENFYNQKIIETKTDIELIETNKYFYAGKKELSDLEKEFKSLVEEIRKKYVVGQEKELEKTQMYKAYQDLKEQLRIKEHRLLKYEAEMVMDRLQNFKNKGYKLKQDIIRTLKNNVELNRTAFVTLTVNQDYYKEKINQVEKLRISESQKYERIKKLKIKNINYQKQIKNITECNSLFTKQFNNYRKKYDFFKNCSYIASVEKQKNGNVHYHALLFDIDVNDFELYDSKRKIGNKWFVRKNSKFLDKVWRYGFNDFVLLTEWNEQKDKEQTSLDVALYMSKYITKENELFKLSIKEQLNYLENHKFEKLVLKSRNLAKFDILKTIGEEYDPELIQNEYNSSYMLPINTKERKEIKQIKKFIKKEK